MLLLSAASEILDAVQPFCMRTGHMPCSSARKGGKPMASASSLGTVIVADDDAASRLIAQLTLERAGFHVIPLGNGADALQRARSEEFCALVLDVHMPLMTGLEVARQVRQWEAERGLRARPILALTASAFADEQSQCLAAGMNEVITKPFALGALAERIRQWCLRGERQVR
jgi:CheY-like chemotaxis protein